MKAVMFLLLWKCLFSITDLQNHPVTAVLTTTMETL